MPLNRTAIKKFKGILLKGWICLPLVNKLLIAKASEPADTTLPEGGHFREEIFYAGCDKVVLMLSSCCA